MPRERLGKVTSMEKGHSPVQSIDRLFDIVEALSNAPRGMACLLYTSDAADE